jgi:hypothetical protein
MEPEDMALFHEMPMDLFLCQTMQIMSLHIKREFVDVRVTTANIWRRRIDPLFLTSALVEVCSQPDAPAALFSKKEHPLIRRPLESHCRSGHLGEIFLSAPRVQTPFIIRPLRSIPTRQM